MVGLHQVSMHVFKIGTILFICSDVDTLFNQDAGNFASTGNLYFSKVEHKFVQIQRVPRYIKRTEGMRGLYKGLGPNIVGVAPSRAIYFWAYSTAKKYVNASLPKRNRDTPLVHVLAAGNELMTNEPLGYFILILQVVYIFDVNINKILSGMAGFTASSLTNPIWLVKTRLQLDKASGENTLSVRKCIRNIVREYVSPISLSAVYPQDCGEISFRTMLLRLRSEVEQRVLRNLTWPEISLSLYSNDSMQLLTSSSIGSQGLMYSQTSRPPSAFVLEFMLALSIVPVNTYCAPVTRTR